MTNGAVRLLDWSAGLAVSEQHKPEEPESAHTQQLVS